MAERRTYLPRLVRVVVAATLLACATALGQFSPGELSSGHQQLEGPQNCTRCHEVGKTISGQKCLACHTEISRAVSASHGFHYAVREKQCVECHKEHLGRAAMTYQFDSASFEHSRTGYALRGKHAAAKCIDCHRQKMIADPGVAKNAGERSRPIYLGLRNECYACHSNPHENDLAQKCASCHTEEAWSRTKQFDHASTKFPLRGKHAAVQCRLCHTSMGVQTPGAQRVFRVEDFSACESCHKNPHGTKFQQQTCVTCHTEQGWNAPAQKKFDHAMTGFPLTGKHAAVACDKCHKEAKGASFSQKYKLPHSACIDCHADEHRGEFRRTYNNDCSRCHTASGWSPSSYAVTAHNLTKFPLTLSHLAVRCQQCHLPAKEKRSMFHFDRTDCDACHRTVHEQGTGLKADSSRGCLTCHTVDSWQSVAYNHAVTGFTLTGGHLRVACTACHKRQASGAVKVPFKGLRQPCAGCHGDVHNGQFAKDGTVACERCHSTERWKALVFDHQKQSSFALTGGHLKVPCDRCHKPEPVGEKQVTRYKPLAAECEACHGRSKVR